MKTYNAKNWRNFSLFLAFSIGFQTQFENREMPACARDGRSRLLPSSAPPLYPLLPRWDLHRSPTVPATISLLRDPFTHRLLAHVIQYLGKNKSTQRQIISKPYNMQDQALLLISSKSVNDLQKCFDTIFKHEF